MKSGKLAVSEKRLIDANALLKQLSNYMEKIHCVDDLRHGVYRGMEITESYIKNAPTVDAVEVVHCKDCRWARPQDHREPTCTPAEALICQCFMHHHIPAPWGARLAVNPDDFCSYGERRTDNA